jgi:DNA-binding transcriptional ArsR family regulator
LVDEAAESNLEKRVGGEYVTFRVYVYLLRAGEASVRDVYRGCDLSSPSLALHHLEKLEGLNLVRRDEDGVYHAVARKFGVLRFFYRTGAWLLPRSFFYVMLYTAIGFASALLLPYGMREVGIILSALGFATNLVDTVLFLRLIR